MNEFSNITNIYKKSPNMTGKSRSAKSDSDEALYGIFYDKNKGVNGEIDEGFFQGQKGDCWLLSGVLSLSYTDDGKELIKNAISKDQSGDYYVYFKGLNKLYKVTKEELADKNISTIKNGLGLEKSTYSTGDDDMLLMELAVEKVVEEGEADIETSDGITGGSAYYLYKLLTGNDVQYAYGDDFAETANLLLDYKANKDEYSATLGVANGFAGLEDDHAYAIKDFNTKEMTLVNPWNSTEDVKIPTSSLFKNVGNYDISVVDVEA